MDEEQFDRWTSGRGERRSRRGFGAIALGVIAAFGLDGAGDAKRKKKKKKQKPPSCTPDCGDNVCGGDGQLEFPEGIAVDSADNVFVTDTGNFRVQKFDSTGAFLSKWGSFGDGDDEFVEPFGIAVDSADNVYVVDQDNHRVQKFDSDGNFLTKWGSFGDGDGQLKDPFGIAVDSADNVFVTDTGNHRIQKFRPV